MSKKLTFVKSIYKKQVTLNSKTTFFGPIFIRPLCINISLPRDMMMLLCLIFRPPGSSALEIAFALCSLERNKLRQKYLFLFLE